MALDRRHRAHKNSSAAGIMETLLGRRSAIVVTGVAAANVGSVAPARDGGIFDRGNTSGRSRCRMNTFVPSGEIRPKLRWRSTNG